MIFNIFSILQNAFPWIQTYTHFNLLHENGKKKYICSVKLVNSFNMMGSVKWQIHMECMYNMLNGIIDQNGMQWHKNEDDSSCFSPPGIICIVMYNWGGPWSCCPCVSCGGMEGPGTWKVSRLPQDMIQGQQVTWFCVFSVPLCIIPQEAPNLFLIFTIWLFTSGSLNVTQLLQSSSEKQYQC